MLIQPVPWVFGYELCLPIVIKSSRKPLESILPEMIKFFFILINFKFGLYRNVD